VLSSGYGTRISNVYSPWMLILNRTAATNSIFAYIGVELLVITAGEAKNPRQDLPGAAKRIYRIPVILYTVSAVLVAFNIPYTDPSLFAHGDPTSISPMRSNSPFIIAVKEAGIPVLPALINAAIIIVAWDVS
jgi:yeast amino acid transporter